MQTIKRSILVLMLGLGFSLTACDGGDDDETGDDGPIDILGSYVDQDMTGQTINETHWITEGDGFGSTYTILEYDNAEMTIIVQNDDTNDYAPGLYSRFDWTWDGADLYYCQTVYDGATIDDARDGSSSDASDLATGCGETGFSWSMLTPA